MGKQRFRRSRFDQPTKNGDKIRGEPRRIVSWFYPTMNTSIESSKRKKKNVVARVSHSPGASPLLFKRVASGCDMSRNV